MRYLYLFMSCLFSVCLVQAQEFDAVKNITPAAPEAAQFQKYGDIPVSYYTGTPSINIPLYTIQEYDISVPIGLSYHASGVKLTEMASWVGTGWSLSAGGMLSRSVRGKPDFSNHLDETGLDTYFGGTTIPTSLDHNDYDYVVDIVTQERDVQPDEYYLNFLGVSTKFYINQSKEIIVDPSSKLKIEGPSSTDQYWVVTDASGTKYTFGNSTDSREISKYQPPGYASENYVSSWYLTKITSASGHEVTFDYQIATSFTHLPNQRHHANFSLLTGINTSGWICYDIPNYDQSGNLLRGGSGSPYEFKPVKLTQINFERGGEDYTVEFVANTSREDAYDLDEESYLEYNKLNFLHVKQGVGKRLSYIFNFDNRRNGLWLMSLNRVSYSHNGFDGGIEETHSFEYHNYTSLPSAKSFDMDYWGLYNGAGNSTVSNLIPYSPSYTAGADRDYNETYAKYGILTKVTYPTGGYNEFEYEPHIVAPNETAGGLRVKKITTSTQGGPGKDPDMVREFIYKAPGATNSSGNRSAPFGNSYQTRLYHQCDNNGTTVYYELDDLTAISSHSVNGSGFMSIGYSAVQELIGTGGANGRNVYEFTHVSSPFYETGFEPEGYEEIFSPVYFNNLANGRMTKKLTQKKVGSSYQTLTETENTYQTVVDTDDYIAGLATSLIVDGANNGTLVAALGAVKPTGDFLDVVAYLPYRIKPDWVKLTKTVEHVYEDGVNPITKTIDYTKSNYGDRWFHDFTTTQKVTYDVSGDIETTYITYPFSSSSTINDALRDKYIISPVSSTRVKGTSLISLSKVIGGSKTTFTSQSLTVGGSSISLPLPDEQYQLTQGQYNLSSADGGGQEVLVGKYITYNDDGLPTEVEDALGHKTGLIWHKDLLLATCANASVSEFFYEGFEYDTGATSGDAHTGNKYESGDYTIVFPVTGNRNYIVSYWYLSGSTWLYMEKNYTGTNMVLSEGTAIDDVRVYPADAQMATYTHDTFFGVTSQSGPNNRPAYYIYDAAGRLKLLKDQDGNILQAYDFKFLASTTD